MPNDEIIEYLRTALNHFYDPTYLQQSPLISILGLENQHNPVEALQKRLRTTITSMEPTDDVPADARSWRIYELLFCRFVQQMSAANVAAQLGISERHLRREQRAALEALLMQLTCDSHIQNVSECEQTLQPGSITTTMKSTISDELAWLKSLDSETSCSLADAITSALNLIKPLTGQYNTQIKYANIDSNLLVTIHPVALSQILLNVLSVAVSWLTSSELHISAEHNAQGVQVSFLGTSFYTQPRELKSQEVDNLHLAQQIAEMSGAQLITDTELSDKQRLRIRLHLPSFQRLTVLAIDDNTDTLQLLEHLTTGTRYSILPIRDPKQAIDESVQGKPDIIILDVMMPQIDGWQVLGQLKQHPEINHIPVIVCTILGQAELAYTLGANGFLQKPFNREQLLAALEELRQHRHQSPR